jgi:osmotically inducible protein OsmC
MERNATAHWSGELKTGSGEISLGSGAFTGKYSFPSRFDTGKGTETNPEEMLGGAHAACYSMALAHAAASAGHVARRVETTATVSLGKTDAGMAITGIALVTVASIPGLGEAEFQRLAEDTRTGCIVSRALSAVPVTLPATLRND